MERFLTKELEAELSRITLEYVYKTPSGNPSSFIKRNITSSHIKLHADILLNWMVEENIPYEEEVYDCLITKNIVLAGLYLAELGDMIFHISKREESPFNIVYCPDTLQDFQKLRLRLWWEYFFKHQKYCEINHMTHEGNVIYVSNQLDSFLEEQHVLDDEYVKKLVQKFYL